MQKGRWNFRNLKVWKLGMDLMIQIYALVKNFPKDEVYGLSSQMKRSVFSIPTNIAEWNERMTNKDFAHFLTIALWSCVELETQLEWANLLWYIHYDEKKVFVKKIWEIKRMLKSLRDKLYHS